MVWYQGGLKPDNPRGFIDVNKIGNGAIFEGTKGSILADFTTRLIIPNNDDGDFTYYKRRSKDQLLPLVAGTGQPTQATQRQARPQGGQGGRRPSPTLPRGMTAMPSATPGANGFPAMQFMEGNIPPAIGMPNPTVEAVLQLKSQVSLTAAISIPSRSTAQRLQEA